MEDYELSAYEAQRYAENAADLDAMAYGYDDYDA